MRWAFASRIAVTRAPCGGHSRAESPLLERHAVGTREQNRRRSSAMRWALASRIAYASKDSRPLQLQRSRRKARLRKEMTSSMPARKLEARLRYDHPLVAAPLDEPRRNAAFNSTWRAASTPGSPFAQVRRIGARVHRNGCPSARKPARRPCQRRVGESEGIPSSTAMRASVPRTFPPDEYFATTGHPLAQSLARRVRGSGALPFVKMPPR